MGTRETMSKYTIDNPINDKYSLYEMYWGGTQEEWLTYREVAEECGYSPTLVLRRLHEFGIPTRDSGVRENFPDESGRPKEFRTEDDDDEQTFTDWSQIT